MSCLGPNYNPNITKAWTRFENRVDSIQDSLMSLKGNVLQYKGNSSSLTKQQIYGKMAQGLWTNKKKGWGTQSDTYTNPNTMHMERNNYSLVPLNPNAPTTDSAETTLVECIKFTTPSQFSYLPTQPSQGSGAPSNTNYIILPPTGTTGNPIPSLWNPIIQPVTNVIVYRDGGSLSCNKVDTPCNNNNIELETKQTNDSSRRIVCHSTSDSDVPGIPQILCWDKTSKTFYPRVRRTYSTALNKWPQGYKFSTP